MNEKKYGISFTGALTIAFIVLKLTNNINWSWMWVLSPLWIPILIYIVIFLIAILIATFISIKDSWSE